MKKTVKTDWKNYLGRCAYHASVGQFLQETSGHWLEQIVDCVGGMFPTEKLTKASIESYSKTYVAMQKALLKRGNSFRRLEIAFEYVIPMTDPAKPPVSAGRADVLLLSADRAMVLEFKTGDGTSKKEMHIATAIRQLHRYFHGLMNFHAYAKETPEMIHGATVHFAWPGMDEKAEFTVPGLASPAAVISPDILSDCIERKFQGHTKPQANPGDWLLSFGQVAMSLSTPDGFTRRLLENNSKYPPLSDVDKALFRRKLADRLSLKTTLPLRPVVHLLTNGDWRLRDAAVQMMSKLGNEPLRALYSASRQLLGEE